MFSKKLLAFSLFFASASIYVSTPASVSAGVDSGSATVGATPPTSITVGESVTFTITYTCTTTWTSATAQLFNGSTMTADNKIGDEVLFTRVYPASLTRRPSGSLADPYLESKSATVTFNEVGTYSVNVDVRNILDGNTPLTDCSVTTSSPVIVTVAAAPTTTVAPTTTTTTLAPTTTAVRTLPKTGSDTNSALIALGVAFAGGAIILGRRRLVTK